jgi:hypothetical protein
MAMHQTTLRFAPDVWQALDEEASRLGVSTAQYIREAAVARLAYGMGRRGDPDFADALSGAGARNVEQEWIGDEAAESRLGLTGNQSATLDRSIG